MQTNPKTKRTEINQAFLAYIKIIDYSLLVGCDEGRKELVVRAQRESALCSSGFSLPAGVG